MKSKHIIETLKHIREKADCNLIDVVDHKEEVTVKLTSNKLLSRSDYMLSFFEADGAGTIGIKIRWTLGKVTGFQEVWKCLLLNGNDLLDQGTLFAAITARGDDAIFSLVGQMLFPPETPAEEIATLWFNQAFMNYVLFEITAPGVTMFR